MIRQILILVFTLGYVVAAQAAEQAKPLKGKDLETAVAMNDIYARHMLNSSCLERQKMYFIPNGVSPQERTSRMESYKTSCECLTNTFLKAHSANDAIDYVTYAYGSPDPAKKVGNQQDSQQRQKFGKMMYEMNVDKKNRQNCGFQK